jgi:RNA polymerase sigma factor (sigma-70 family)
MTEAELIEASRRGDARAFGELVERCARMVDAIAYAATRDRTLSEDLVQDTFVTAWRDLHRLRDACALRPWLCRIARNLAHKARRSRARELETIDADHVGTGCTPYDAMRDREREHLLAVGLARVPALYRETLVLFYFEEQSAKAVAAALGVTEQVVHQRLSRGRRHLAADIERQVEAALGHRRSRRDVAACVLATIAIARVTHAAPRGVTMSKLGTLSVAAVSVTLVTTAVWPTSYASPPPTAHHATAPKKAAPIRPAARPAPAAPAVRVAASADCAHVVRHIVAVSLASLEDAAKAHAAGVQRVTEELEARCTRESWSQREIACLEATVFPGPLEKCRPAVHVAPVEGPPAPVDADVDVSCPSVGAHVADLMIEQLTLDDLANVAAVVLTDTAELPAGAIKNCSDDSWSEPLRRCYAAADRFGQIVACNLRWR